MSDWMLDHEAGVRVVAGVAVFGLMAVWETLASRRACTLARPQRWFANISLVAIDAVVIRLLFPAAAVGMAWAARDAGWGLFPRVALPGSTAVLLSIVLLDLTVYLQHVMFHALPALWRVHRVHHADLDVDVTTGLRFHPIEIVLSMLIKLAVVAMLGPPVLGVLLFEVLLNALAMFNHANARIPAPLDRVLRLFVVTPDMHRVHHSVEPFEHNTNFGFNLSCWDRLFGTYVAAPAGGHEGMTLGLKRFRDPSGQRLWRMLLMPLDPQMRRPGEGG